MQRPRPFPLRQNSNPQRSFSDYYPHNALFRMASFLFPKNKEKDDGASASSARPRNRRRLSRSLPPSRTRTTFPTAPVYVFNPSEPHPELVPLPRSPPLPAQESTENVTREPPKSPASRNHERLLDTARELECLTCKHKYKTQLYTIDGKRRAPFCQDCFADFAKTLEPKARKSAGYISFPPLLDEPRPTQDAEPDHDYEDLGYGYAGLKKMVSNTVNMFTSPRNSGEFEDLRDNERGMHRKSDSWSSLGGTTLGSDSGITEGHARSATDVSNRRVGLQEHDET